ncbi:alpha/beta fold hydrolase [Nesterenkonia sp. CF4.4]|uniref:alpha/beta fold hydrolase n=1 Tax=Nesterenkonia sp. CF4.4 TaxID=3373079 RepID=UPI003EE7261F
MTRMIGPEWRTEIEQMLPGAVTQMQADARTFFDTDVPALLSWRFDAEDARHIDCPVLHIGGRESGPWFTEVRALILTWFPHAEDVLLAGADHSLVLTHAPEIAGVIADFLYRHTLPTRGS